MDAAAPFMVLSGSLDVHGLTVRPGEERANVATGKERVSIEISRKKAYGCGEHGQRIVEGVRLYLHSDFPDLSCSLSISLSDEARRSIEAELGVTPGAGPGVVAAYGAAEIVTEQLLVTMLYFRIWEYSKRFYYLVYDSTDASLYMIPNIPGAFVPSYTTAPVLRFTGVGRDHELILLARRRNFYSGDTNARVCVCTPETRAKAESDDAVAGAGLWQVKTRCFPDPPYPFSVQEAFSFKGKLFWADLSQGLVHCDPIGDSSAVDFGFISLPRGYLFDKELAAEPLKMGRSISCIGGSIQFVCIDRRSAHPGDHMVNVKTLDLDRLRWKDHKGFPCFWKDIWGQASSIDAQSRNVVPRYPTLMPGGALCLLLSNMRRKPGYICTFDMSSKRLLWSGTACDYGDIGSLIMPSSFFTKCCPPPSKRYCPCPPPSEEVLPTNKRKRDK